MNFFSLREFKKSSLILVLSMALVSCTSLSDRKSLFGARSSTDPKTELVSKAQYDQLLKKYEELLKKTKELEASSKEQIVVKGDNPADIVENISKAAPSTELTETVDLFGAPPQKKTLTRSKKVDINAPLTVENIENQIINLRKAWKFVEVNQFNKAMGLLKGLEDSQNKQVRVRAKFLIGEIFYKQGNYDLAMQVFEEVVHTHAFSGMILDTLRRLTVCSDKLKLPKKKELYFSMLHDFF